MRKIGLITFCNHELKVNYGQVLQAYALYKYLSMQGHQVKVINYRVPYEDESGLCFKLFGKTYWYQEHYKKIKEKKMYSERNRKFYHFVRKKINITKPCYTEADVTRELEDCDVFMAGSDQIWNIKAYDVVRLLGVNKNIQRISYASSGLFEENNEAEIVYEQMKKYWSNIDNISVREESGKRIIEKYTGKKVLHVVDPVLLLDKKQWLMENKKEKETYILCYFLGSIRMYSHILEYIKNKVGAKKIIFVEAENTKKDLELGELRRNVGPEEFVRLIYDAEFVCTDSYHGTLFSIIFEKQFCLFKRKEKAKNSFSSEERWKILFEEWGLSERWIRNIKEYENLVDINYYELPNVIKTYIEHSKKYLDSALGEK